jgi:hypothetical protein
MEQTRAKNVPSNLFWSNQVFRVRLRDVALEVGFADHFREVRAGFGVTQEVLREEDDQLPGKNQLISKDPRRGETHGLAEVTVNLAAEDVELILKLASSLLQGQR